MIDEVPVSEMDAFLTGLGVIGAGFWGFKVMMVFDLDVLRSIPVTREPGAALADPTHGPVLEADAAFAFLIEIAVFETHAVSSVSMSRTR